MSIEQVGPSDWLWKEGAGYYKEAAADLLRRPILPDLGRLRDRRLASLFETHAGLRPGARALEIGCGRSPWLPHLARAHRCEIAGIDIEPHAAELARANLAGAGTRGEVLCGDGFLLAERPELRGRFDLVYSMGVMEHFADVVDRLAILAGYLRPDGRILTTVPNLQGINWTMQRLGDLKTLRAHVVYDRRRLARVHEAAGFETVAAGYIGFCDGHLSAAAGTRSRTRRAIHGGLCKMFALASEAWLRLWQGRAAPELPFLAPHVFYVGRLAARPGGAMVAS